VDDTIAILIAIVRDSAAHAEVLIDNDALPVLVALMQCHIESIREQAISALGSISGVSSQCRDSVLAFGILSPLLALLTQSTTMTVVRTASWTLAKLCGKSDDPTPLASVR
jgi:hypothetical protein